MSKFFIDRPVFAWVVAIFIMFFGAMALKTLPVEQYPSVAAPTIRLQTIYPGASASVHEQAVLSVIEREMNGISGLDYMKASASASGVGTLSLTFHSGINPDIAQVNVQNRLSQAEARLPAAVKQNGILVEQASSNFLMVVALQVADGSAFSVLDLNDYAVRNVIPEIQRIDGVGSVQHFGSENSMRIWLNPEKLRGYGLSSAAVSQAIKTQNLQIAAGGIGELPAVEGQMISATVNVQGQLSTVEEFENIIILNKTDGSTVRLKDVARVELGAQSYGTYARVNMQGSAALGIQLSSTGNAVATATAIRERMEQLSQYFPEGVNWIVPYDSSLFVKISITKVLHTLAEAMVLVFIVIFLFLQNIRYTIIPSIVVPISLLGAIALMVPLGMSINVLTMFAMVLVIGIVVDDAIVVVENVERLMAEEGLTPYQATVKSMGQISSAIFGITVVNIVVFIPMAFFSGATGQIFRQFALVMAASIGFSGFLALTLTPALCATLLKPIDKHHESKGFFAWFNRLVKHFSAAYERTLAKFLRISYMMFVVYIALIGAAMWVFVRIPTSFLPEEDQGFLLTMVQLPQGATAERTIETIKEMESIMREKEEIQNITAIQGFSFLGAGQNVGMAFISLKDWAERPSFGQSAKVLSQILVKAFAENVRDATIFALSPPAIPELGTSSGFSIMLEDRGGAGHEALLAARNQLLGLFAQRPDVLTQVRPSGLEDAAQLRLVIHRDAAYAQGVTMADIAQVLGTNLGSAYINDFPNQGRLQRVTMQSDANARMQAEDIMAFNIPNSSGGQVPLGSIAHAEWVMGPMVSDRYNGYPAMGLTGQAAAGVSSGEAMKVVAELAQQLPPGFAIEFTGLSLEEQRAGNQQLYVYLATALIVFLCLAALYESWSIPFAVMLAVPLGVMGVAWGVMGRNLFNYHLFLHFAGEQAAKMAEQFSNDIYFRIGMITVMGLVAKNAILIIEFAKELQEKGIRLTQAALTAAHLRFRPIIMTSFAFILGVVPLYIASGASSASQRAIGTSVFWGMLVGTLLGLLFIPIFFVLVRRLFPMRAQRDPHASTPSEALQQEKNS